MPALHECSPPVCHELVVSGKCPACKAKAWKTQDANRPSYRQRGYTTAWDRERNAFIREFPLCADPFRVHGDRPVAAQVVDHIVPHRGDMNLFWDRENWQSLCRSCHARKTSAEE